MNCTNIGRTVFGQIIFSIRGLLIKIITKLTSLFQIWLGPSIGIQEPFMSAHTM
jgi:hypothetical protein